MRNCLLIISTLLLFLVSPRVAASTLRTDSEVVADTLRTDSEVVADTRTGYEYNVVMNARGNEVSAICMMKVSPDGRMVGTMVNEFGIKIMDFTYEKGKAKVMNVFGPMNKWYIRMVLKKDFTFILTHICGHENVSSGKRSLTIQPNGDILVRNDRYKISYLFSKIKSEE